MLVAAADPHRRHRAAAFARDFNAQSLRATSRELVRRSRRRGRLYRDAASVPRRRTPLSRPSAGKHIILEKPMALTLADCDAIIAAVERANVHLIVGHTHAFDPAVRAMRASSRAASSAALGMIAACNYTNFLYRPRRPGGARYRARRRHPVQPGAASDRHGAADRRRPRCAACARRRPRSIRRGRPRAARSRSCEFENGAAASLVYGGYDFFDSDEMAFQDQRARRAKPPDQHGAARRALAASARRRGRACASNAIAYGSDASRAAATSATFRDYDRDLRAGRMRASADGLFIYDQNGAREDRTAERGGVMPGRSRCSTT